MSRTFKLLICCAIFLSIVTILTGCQTHGGKADQLVIGKVWTGNPEKPWAEGFAVSGDSIIAVGTGKELRAYQGEKTQLITAAAGQLVVPGFIDNHTHFIDGGYMLSSVQLRDARTPAEFINRIKAFSKTIKPGEWILGGNWDHQNWGGELPDRIWIDSVTKDNPVWINRLDGHSCLANSLALKMAGVDDKVKDMQGGNIVRKHGRITGILQDNAIELVKKAIPDPNAEQLGKALEAAMHYVASSGITSIVGMVGATNNTYFDLYQKYDEEHKLITRIYAAQALREWNQLAARVQQKGSGNKWFKTGGLKGFMDGSLGAHTAAFIKPFTDAPMDSGLMVENPDVVYRYVKAADSAGLQIFVHAIGDRSIHTLLDIFERVEKENGPRDRRFRMEHAQHIDPADFPRFAQLNVVPSMQPYHAIDDGRWAEKFIGHDRAVNTYAFRSLLDAKAKLAFGSDWFVAPASPIFGIYAAVTRRTINGMNPEGWIPQQKITVEEAMRAYTLDAAYAIFEEKKRGSIEAGKLADFVILEKDITTIQPAEIENVQVLRTYVGGKLVFQHE